MFERIKKARKNRKEFLQRIKQEADDFTLSVTVEPGEEVSGSVFCGSPNYNHVRYDFFNRTRNTMYITCYQDGGYEISDQESS